MRPALETCVGGSGRALFSESAFQIGSGNRSRCQFPLVEFGEQLILRVGDGLGAAGGDLGCGLGLTDGAFGLGGEEGAIALGVGVALGYGGGDAGGAGLCRGGTERRAQSARRIAGVAGAVGGEPFGDLLLQGEGRVGGFRFRRRLRRVAVISSCAELIVLKT